MPRQIDLFPQNLQVSNNPLNQLGMTTGQLTNMISELTNLPALELEAIEQFITQLLTYIDQATGLDLLPFWQAVENSLGSLTTLFGQLNPLSGSFDPLGAVITFLQLVVSYSASLPGTLVSDLSGIWGSVGATFADIEQALFGITGGSQSELTTIGSNLMQLLGNPSGLPNSVFDAISAAEQMIQNVLTPAGALSTLTQIPTHLFGGLQLGNASTNLLPDGSFNSPNAVAGGGLWSYDATVDHTGTTGSGSVMTTGASVLRQFEGVPIAMKAGGQTSVSTYTKWAGVTATTGHSIQLSVNAYDSTDAPISDPVNRIVQAIQTAPASSVGYSGTDPITGQSLTADSNGWVALAGGYIAPAGTAYVRICLEVEATVTAGTIHFDDCTQTLVSGVLDAGLLSNIENIPQILGASVQGAQGITDVISTFGHIVDGLASSFLDGSSVTGASFADLFGLAQTTASSATTANSLATSHQAVLENRTNYSTATALDPTAEATFDLQALPHGATLPTTTVATGTAIAGYITMGRAATKGFVEFLASATSGSTGIYTNVYAVNPSTGLRTLLWGSLDISATIGTGMGYVRAVIPGASQPAVNASDLIMLGIVNQGSGTVTVCAKQMPQPNRSSGILKNFGMTRSTGGTVSPGTIADSAFTYSGLVPWIAFGIENVPANYQPPQTFAFTTVGTHTATAPSWWRSGIDYLDRIALGGGAGGGAGWGGTGTNGGNTTITVGASVITGTGGIASSATGFSTGNYQGLSPGNETYQGVTYFGGAEVGYEVPGSAPGGGGGAGEWNGATGAGGGAGSWATATSQPTTTTVTAVVGGGGSPAGSFAAQGGAAGAAWVVFRQNPSA